MATLTMALLTMALLTMAGGGHRVARAVARPLTYLRSDLRSRATAAHRLALTWLGLGLGLGLGKG